MTPSTRPGGSSYPGVAIDPTFPKSDWAPWPPEAPSSGGSTNFARGVSPRTPRALQGFGLSSREARVYLALVTHGPLGARRATEFSGLHRATAYRVLAQLMARGLVHVQPRWPREYHPVPLRSLVERSVAFLRDEIELRHWLLRALPSAPDHGGANGFGIRSDRLRLTPPGVPDAPNSVPVGVTAIGSANDSPLLDQLRSARRGVDALVRPLMIPAGLRSKVAHSLTRLATRGLPVRVVLDYLAADCRFAAQFRRERLSPAQSLEIRHYTPLGGHAYLIDGRAAIRFPVSVCAPSEPDFGFISEEPDFVRAQFARFEAVWDDAVPRRGVRVTGEPST
ncbi:MAG: TrmB family transcriptional regulator, partial [Thermoplasmata archaeon]